jgi:ribosomal protein S18 acetylase RimI-like enzyme
VILREATQDDWPAIWSFLEPVMRAGDTYTVDPEISEDDARAMWLAPLPQRTFVAVDGNVLGVAKLSPNHSGPASHISNASFVVDPAQSGRGVGRALGEHVLEEARAEDYRAMQFNAVVSTNERAVRLWQSLGFEIVGTLREGFRHPTDGYVGLHIMYRLL